MARVAIVTDSTADLPADLRDRLGITVVPLNVQFGDEVFRDQVDLTTDQFMTRLARAPALPTTSQPSPALFEEIFRRLATDHDGIVAVLLSAKLSGTLQAATLAAGAVADLIPVEIVDSRNGSMGLGHQAWRAADLARQGLDAPAIAGQLRAETTAHHVVFFVDTLEFLQRNGRIGRAAALIGGVLQLKPLLRVDEGQVVPFERTRTRGKAIQGLIDFVNELPHVERLSVLSSGSGGGGPDVTDLADRLAAATGLPRDEIAIVQMGPVIASHVGPGAVGVAVFEGDNP
jgi:DegV family protein with EDD domain